MHSDAALMLHVRDWMEFERSARGTGGSSQQSTQRSCWTCPPVSQAAPFNHYDTPLLTTTHRNAMQP